MTKEELKEIAREGLEAWGVAIRELDFKLIEEVYSQDYVNHSNPPGTPPGLEPIRESVTRLHETFPDAHYKVDDQIAEGDKVVTRYRACGTHEKEWLGVPPTGKYGEMKGITIDRIRNGQIVETWYLVDAYGYRNYLRGEE